MPPDVDYAMSVVQLTGILIPLLLGVTRYYVKEENENLISVSNETISIYLGLLFMPLFIAFHQSLTIITAYGNDHLTIAVFCYGAFLALLFASIPYSLNQQKLAYVFGGMGVISLVVGFVLLATGVPP
ncbi:hypothetical protein HAPAU_42070 [Halalkalicoccus paucihalophilus]|uniref:Uncharacterized protein n=1 Tax=Halalkalicoccus paucihalophilus TaxID=1008153 RepID=A0A151A8L5_9EURY|nr:hypothetical protein [Halalkalicoccus paucihalophilus]KYH23727.1 hypothetical protein HAPAU_42070 [Halalkalicoccus paucihalophilus]